MLFAPQLPAPPPSPLACSNAPPPPPPPPPCSSEWTNLFEFIQAKQLRIENFREAQRGPGAAAITSYAEVEDGGVDAGGWVGVGVGCREGMQGCCIDGRTWQQAGRRRGHAACGVLFALPPLAPLTPPTAPRSPVARPNPQAWQASLLVATLTRKMRTSRCVGGTACGTAGGTAGDGDKAMPTCRGLCCAARDVEGLQVLPCCAAQRWAVARDATLGTTATPACRSAPKPPHPIHCLAG